MRTKALEAFKLVVFCLAMVGPSFHILVVDFFRWVISVLRG